MAAIGETELDVGILARALWRRGWLLVLLAVIAAVGTYVALGYVAPLYTADTRILIEDRESPLTRPREATSDTTSNLDESAIQSQVEVLRSREIADMVIDKLDLTHEAELDPARHPSLLRSLLVVLGLRENPADASIRQRVMDAYFERLSVFPLERSRVIGVEFSATDPVLAAKVANMVADAFVELQQNAKRQSATAATEWLGQEIDRLRQRVAEAEKAVADYRDTHDLFDVDQSGTANSGTLSSQQLSDINAELARARAARAEAEARADLVQKLLDNGEPLDASVEVLSSQLIQRLRERQGALRAQIAELSTTLLPAHPRIRALKEQVDNLEGQIREETRKVLASLQTAARVAAAREESLVKSLNEAKVDVSRTNDQGIELHALEREAAAQRELLESFLSRYREASARTNSNYLPADARIISNAVPPSVPSFPKKTMMSVAAAFAVLLIGSAIVLLSTFMSGRAFRSVGYEASAESAPLKPAASLPAPLEEEADAPRVVRAESAPEVKPEPQEEAPEAEPSSAAIEDEEVAEEEQAKAAAEDGVALAAATAAAAVVEKEDEEETEDDHERPGAAGLGDLLADPSIRVALFSGAEGGEGAGEIAFTAASIAAEQKLRCILVDVGRKPSEALGLERPGLGDLLAGDAAFGEVIQRDEDSHVHVIPLGVLGESAPLQRMQLVIGALTHTYDKVIIVADRLDDWPHEHVRPDIAAIVCDPETSEDFRTEAYDTALARGAKSAIIVRLSDTSESAAA